mmetsp:Transcript_160695/g.283338  ORF Transcript_160695/g.283338 Transcript_160695/m.283338 type:complete len:224 (+) Transcript_160695:58-729(+)
MLEYLRFKNRVEALRKASEGGTSLDPLLRGFHDGSFQADLQNFVAARASAFQVTCADGSHPLVWTQYHREFRDMFERQLENVLASLNIPANELPEFLKFMQELVNGPSPVGGDTGLPGSGGVNKVYFDQFIDAMTSAENYDVFLNVMFNEVRRQQAAAAAAAAPEATATTQEIEVGVPEGMGPGQMIAVEYLGARYELPIPDGYGPGMTFRVPITLPSAVAPG